MLKNIGLLIVRLDYWLPAGIISDSFRAFWETTFPSWFIYEFPFLVSVSS
jgi:hypothetical protein